MNQVGGCDAACTVRQELSLGQEFAGPYTHVRTSRFEWIAGFADRGVTEAKVSHEVHHAGSMGSPE